MSKENETKEKLKSTDEGRKRTNNVLSFDIKCIQIEGQDLEITLKNSSAPYHHSCKNAYNNRMYKRHLEKEKESSNLESEDILKSLPTKRRLSTESNEVTSYQGICCFGKCIDKQENLVAAGTLYTTKTKTQIDHVKNMTANWFEMAKVLQDENLLVQISHGDVALNKMCYHKSSIKRCNQKYRKRCIKKRKEKGKIDKKTSVKRWFKIRLLNKSIHHIKQTENENPGLIFEVKQLESTYIEILKSYEYLLKVMFPDLEIR